MLLGSIAMFCGFMALVAFGSDAIAQEPAVCGVHRGAVVSGSDPAGRDRVKVQIPALGSQPLWAERVYAKNPLRAPPVSVGDPVFLLFEGCDPARPVMIGFARP